MRTEFGSVNCWTEVRNRGQIVFKSGMKTDVGTWVYWEKGFRMWKTSLLKIIEWFLVYVKHLLEIILTSECYFSTYCQVNLLITQFHLFIDGCCSFIFNVLGIHKWCFFFSFLATCFSMSLSTLLCLGIISSLHKDSNGQWAWMLHSLDCKSQNDENL